MNPTFEKRLVNFHSRRCHFLGFAADFFLLSWPRAGAYYYISKWRIQKSIKPGQAGETICRFSTRRCECFGSTINFTLKGLTLFSKFLLKSRKYDSLETWLKWFWLDVFLPRITVSWMKGENKLWPKLIFFTFSTEIVVSISSARYSAFIFIVIL